MGELYDFKDADGNSFRANPRVGRSSSLATSQSTGSLIATLEVHHRGADEEAPTEREPTTTTG